MGFASCPAYGRQKLDDDELIDSSVIIKIKYS